MEAKTIIKLYEWGITDEEGKVCKDAIADIAFEEGEGLGKECCNSVACGANHLLVLMEGMLKAAYVKNDDKQFLDTIKIQCLVVGYELPEDIDVLLECPEAMSIYFENFLMGFSDVILEKIGNCRKCVGW